MREAIFSQVSGFHGKSNKLSSRKKATNPKKSELQKNNLPTLKVNIEKKVPTFQTSCFYLNILPTWIPLLTGLSFTQLSESQVLKIMALDATKEAGV